MVGLGALALFILEEMYGTSAVLHMWRQMRQAVTAWPHGESKGAIEFAHFLVAYIAFATDCPQAIADLDDDALEAATRRAHHRAMEVTIGGRDN